MTISLDPPKKVTKREVTSRIGKLFDPIGYLQPVVITAKIIIQDLWKEGGGWDQEVSEGIKGKWLQFEAELKALEQLEIPRWIGTKASSTLKIHAFCDASEKAYAAVLYIEAVNEAGKSEINMISSKSKVAPLKKKTIPRLELCAAVLLVDLVKDVTETFKTMRPLNEIQRTFWTDSTVALHWISKLPCQLKQYVGNRVEKIQEEAKQTNWRHVPTAHNPADQASRGVSAQELINSRLWWAGPEWLPNESNWPSLPPHLTEEMKQQAGQEEKSILLVNLVVKTEPLLPDSTGQGILQRHSALHRALRVVAIVQKFLNAIKRRVEQIGNRQEALELRQAGPAVVPTSKEELDDALLCVLRDEQERHYAGEIRMISAGKGLPERSTLAQLKPFIGQGLLRMGSRTSAQEAEYDTKFPIIVPNNGQLVQLLIDEAHSRTLHGGTQAILQYLRDRFWFTRMRQIVRSRNRLCIICTRFRAATGLQQMANLPAYRVRPSPPFQHTGVDYAGPATLKAYEGARKLTHKGYIAVFICMATRAVHIEVVTSLTTQAFLEAFTRFQARRGNCIYLHSDNGTTFVGAAHELEEVWASWQAEATIQALSAKGIKWTFITPSAPHQGGIWEAAVKSMKFHLKRVTRGHRFTYEHLTTVTTQVEACLNSRPLFAPNDDPNDTRVITPADLIGGGPIITPLVNRSELGQVSPSRRWAFLQAMVANFWQQWQDDYLATLQRAMKWTRATPNWAVGDIVLVENLPPAMWALGRIAETFPGRDGFVRNVKVKTAVGHLDRAVQKLVRLPVEQQRTDERSD